MGEKIVLQFPSLQLLWAFRLEVDAHIFEMNTGEKKLICNCTKEHIELATTKYKAKVIELPKEQA